MTQTPGIHPYLLRFWGQAQQAVAERNGLAQNDDGAVAVWFSTPEERQAFIAEADEGFMCWDRIDHGSEDWQGEAIDAYHQQIAEVTLRYEGRDYTYRHNFGYGYPWHSVEFMYHEGNYACDCNRSSFIESYAGVSLDPDAMDDKGMVCGYDIELVSLAKVTL